MAGYLELSLDELTTLQRVQAEGVVSVALYADGKRLMRGFKLNILCEELCERGLLTSQGRTGDRASPQGQHAAWTLSRTGEAALAAREAPMRRKAA